MAKIGVVTVTYNSGVVLEDFMQSMLKQNHDDWILYVIDNDSKDNTLELLATYPQDKIKIVANKINYGVAKGNNQGIEAALADGCDFVLLLNNDTEFDENLFIVLLNDLLTNNADMSSPKMMYYEPKNLIWCAGGGFSTKFLLRNYHRGDREIDVGQYNNIYLCDYVPTCCVLIRKCLFTSDSVGMMDEKYFVYYDDTDWMWRAKTLKAKLIYTPNITLYHKVSSLTGGISRFTMNIFFRNRIYFIRKNMPWLYRVSNLFFIILFTLIKLLFNKLPRKYTREILASLYNGFRLNVER